MPVGGVNGGLNTQTQGPGDSVRESAGSSGASVNAQGDTATVKLAPSPLAQAANNAEEMGALLRTNTRIDSEEDRDEKLEEELEKKIKEIPDLPSLENIKNFLEEAAKYKDASPEDLLKLAGKYSGDPGHQDELLDLLAKFSGGDEAFQNKIQEARNSLDQTAVRITHNVTKALHDDGVNPEGMQEWRDSARRIADQLDPVTVQTLSLTIREIVSHSPTDADYGKKVHEFNVMVAAELASTTAAMPREQLTHMMSQLKGGKALTSMHEACGFAAEKFNRIDQNNTAAGAA